MCVSKRPATFVMECKFTLKCCLVKCAPIIWVFKLIFIYIYSMNISTSKSFGYSICNVFTISMMWKQHTKSPEYRVIIKMSNLCRNFHYTDKAVWRPSYPNNGNTHSWKGGFMLRRGPRHFTFYSLFVPETMPTNLTHLHLAFWRRYVSKSRMYRNVPTRLTHFCSHRYYRYWIMPKYSERGFLGSYIGNSVHPTEGAKAFSFVAFLSTMTSVVVTHIYWITFDRKVLVCTLNLNIHDII